MNYNIEFSGYNKYDKSDEEMFIIKCENFKLNFNKKLILNLTCRFNPKGYMSDKNGVDIDNHQYQDYNNYFKLQRILMKHNCFIKNADDDIKKLILNNNIIDYKTFPLKIDSEDVITPFFNEFNRSFDYEFFITFL